MSGASNIFFPNGDLDPWYSGGIIHNVTGTFDVISFIVTGGAHHSDLRAPNPADPPATVEARAIGTAAMQRWIAQSNERAAQRAAMRAKMEKNKREL